jgi:hypothetical protein
MTVVIDVGTEGIKVFFCWRCDVNNGIEDEEPTRLEVLEEVVDIMVEES